MAEKCKERDRKHGRVGGRDRGVKEGTLGWKVKLSLHLVIRSRVGHGRAREYLYPMQNKKMSCQSLIILTGSKNRLWVIFGAS